VRELQAGVSQLIDNDESGARRREAARVHARTHAGAAEVRAKCEYRRAEEEYAAAQRGLERARNLPWSVFQHLYARGARPGARLALSGDSGDSALLILEILEILHF